MSYNHLVMKFSRFLVVFALLTLPLSASAALTPEERAELERQLDEVNQQIAQNQAELSKKQSERQSLERDVAILDAGIRDTQLAIKQRDLAVRKLTDGITDKEAAIKVLDGKVAEGQESVAQMIRRTHEIDGITIAELALGGSITDLFTEIDNYQIVQQALDDAFKEMAIIRADLSARREALQSQQEEEQSILQLQKLEREKLQKSEREKQQLVSAVKGQEANYQKIIAERQQTASQIRARLFQLADSSEISFGVAYDLAKAAGAASGVRPAFVLGILKNESDLGRNVGQCLLTNDPAKGNGKGANTGTAFAKVMHPTRDVDPFLEITAELGIDWQSQRVSCPQAVGYGGAMGPSQFIASTWMMYKDRVAAATGMNPPNPWDNRAAFTASAIFLSDIGAARGTREGEREAALRYFAGGNWKNPSFASYGTRVLGFADEFQAQIDVLEGR
jgi:peptidoglycan hydrolase CwlO-like protein